MYLVIKAMKHFLLFFILIIAMLCSFIVQVNLDKTFYGSIKLRFPDINHVNDIKKTIDNLKSKDQLFNEHFKCLVMA